MYADDTTLLISSSDPGTLQKELDLQLNNIINWFRLNKLTLNIKKTKLMLFGTKQNLTKFDDIKLNYDSEEIERVDKFKYLGVILDPTLSWDDHVQFLSNNVSKRIGVVCRVKYFLPPCTLNKLAKALVFPHFDQCSSVWSNFIAEHHNRLQILQNRLARVLLSADIRTPIDKLMKDLGWNKLKFRWEQQLLILTFKCLTSAAPSYLSCHFTFMHATHEKGTRSQTHNALVVPSWNIIAGKRTFLYRASAIWNELASHIRLNFNTMSVQQFKNNISL